jgi:hypothetical protein
VVVRLSFMQNCVGIHFCFLFVVADGEGYGRILRHGLQLVYDLVTFRRSS